VIHVPFFFPLRTCALVSLAQVHARRVDPSALVFSLSSHRHSYLGLLFSSRFMVSIINNNTTGQKIQSFRNSKNEGSSHQGLVSRFFWAFFDSIIELLGYSTRFSVSIRIYSTRSRQSSSIYKNFGKLPTCSQHFLSYLVSCKVLSLLALLVQKYKYIAIYVCIYVFRQCS
jgi:hypothetical protein